jgi:RNA polymerase sigma-70 factor (ECF subfamily)
VRRGDAVEEGNLMAEMAQALSWGRDEVEVVQELQAGSAEAFDALIRRYHAPVYRLLCQMLGNSADAADTTQEVFLKAFRGIRGFRSSSSLKTWLYRIAIREALNRRRWWHRHQSRESSYDDTALCAGEALLAADEPTPYDHCAAREAREAVHRALAQLPEAFRSAVVLRDIEDLSYEEVAEVLDVSIGTVKSRILRGRRALRELLESKRNSAAAPMPNAGRMAREMAGGEQ